MEEEKKEIFGSTSTADIKKKLQGIPSIHLKDGQMKRFKDYIKTFGINAFRSWKDYVSFHSILDVSDGIFRRATKEDMPAVVEYVMDTGGVLIRACKEKADSEFAFCSWTITNELNEVIPNVGWGPPPPVPENPPYRISDVPVKGKALVATCTIKAGETILKERPIILSGIHIPIFEETVDKYFDLVLSVLSPEDRDAFNALSDAGKPDSLGSRLFRIADTNRLGVLIPESKYVPYGGIFKIVSRCNHRLVIHSSLVDLSAVTNHSCSCSPTAKQSFSSKALLLELRATRTIKAGEEITIAYATLYNTASVRQEDLKRRYQFECKCETCSLEPAKLKESDERRKRIASLNATVSMRLWASAKDRPVDSGNSTGTGRPASVQEALQMVNKISTTAKGHFAIDSVTNEVIRLWSAEDLKIVRVRYEQFINLHMNVLRAVRAEKLNSDQFGFIRWIVRAYAVLGDKENTKRWAMEARKALKISDSKYGSFRDFDPDSMHAWDQIVQDPSRHPEWDAIEKKYQDDKLSFSR